MNERSPGLPRPAPDSPPESLAPVAACEVRARVARLVDAIVDREYDLAFQIGEDLFVDLGSVEESGHGRRAAA